MPSALETLIKIIKLERDQGGKDAAVVGGLTAYSESWENEAREQAKRATHHILIDEIVDVLAQYGKMEGKDERTAKLRYLLDRITNRIPAPQAYRDRLPVWEAKLPKVTETPPKESVPRREREHSDQRQARPSRSKKPGAPPPRHQNDDENAAWDEDYINAPKLHELDIKPLPTLSRPPRLERPQYSEDEALALITELEAPTTRIKGIGVKLAELLEQLDILTVGDLLYNLPRTYQDYTEFKCIKDLEADEIGPVIATVTHANIVIGKGKREDYVVRVSDGSGKLSARFFNQSFLSYNLQSGDQIVLSGKVSIYQDILQMANPEWEHLEYDNLHTTGIVPIYRMTKGMRPRIFRKTMKALSSEWARKYPDPVPLSVLDRTELGDLGWAIQQIHFPEGLDHLDHAKRRLVFDDLLMLQLAVLRNRRAWQATPSVPLEVSDQSLADFIGDAFPFALTAAQNRAIAEIRSDIAQAIPMNRLLQGDVGSGKTAVATVAMAIAVHNKRQAALMAPTGILAEQHYRELSKVFGGLSIEEKPVIALLTSALSVTERESILRGIADGSIDFVIGTHALIQEDVEFHDLGLAAVDEQHRFGVDQRARLRGKGRNPHLLVMTATPIPRTLALTLHADLDLTVIEEKPPGRLEVVTKVIDPVARERLHGFVISQLEAGRQAFFVHPLVEESEEIETASATEAYERLQQVFFRQRVCLLHGRMSPMEKDRVMAEFGRGEYDVMVTTTVAEVGVDVPNASVIVIDGANRFGLAQLHQLRGRVGRGMEQSYCFLIPDNAANIDVEALDEARDDEEKLEKLSIAGRRLLEMERSNDGFALAELDWQLRGAGDLLGRRQSGQRKAIMPEAMSPELVLLAQREARTLFDEDPDLQLPEHRLLARSIRTRYADAGDVS